MATSASRSAVVHEAQAVTCGSYRGRTGDHVVVSNDASLTVTTKVDAWYAVCETGPEKLRCQVMLARDDVVSVVKVVSTSRDRAEEVLRVAAAAAAEKLMTAW
jgi:hypothetical protein